MTRAARRVTAVDKIVRVQGAELVRGVVVPPVVASFVAPSPAPSLRDGPPHPGECQPCDG
ncbi:MAG: hypothetical protein OXC68_11350 [Aestuariivita sp.]|nr:hypothetical protein [Aestuariivita sp.]